MDEKLFLIGNGFDIAHGFETSYLHLMSWMNNNDFNTFFDFNTLLLRNFLTQNGYMFEDECSRYKRPRNDIDLRIKCMDISYVESTKEYKLLEKHFCEPLILYALWESLEENMHYVFLDEEFAEARMERESLRETLEDEEYGQVIEADIDVFHRPAQNNFDKLAGLADRFECNLLQWVGVINETICSMEDLIYSYQNENGSKTINLLEDDFFCKGDYIINFNYSETIEQLYSKEVCHIHGKDSLSDSPIMGHTNDYYDMYRNDDREIVLVEKFYKDFDSILISHADYFNKIKNVDEIVVLGLGYRNTDYPYFEKINSIIPMVKWSLYYFSDDDYKRAQEYVEKLNLKNQNVKYISLKTETPYTKIIRY